MDYQRLADTIGEPSVPGLYDVLLNGTTHWSSDKVAVDRFPWKSAQGNASANRAFMQRAVRFLAGQGICQYLDLGCASPTDDGTNVHQVARSLTPGARVVYVDNDPRVWPHARAHFRDPGMAYLEADIRDPETILRDPVTHMLIDWSEPVGVLLITTLHFVSDGDDPIGLVARYLRDAVSGSFLVMSHVCSDEADPDLVVALRKRVFGGITARPQTAIQEMLYGFPLVEPGRLVDVRHWPVDTGEEPSELPLLAGVARVG